METSWATENLHVIRTLMERSALYRRALAPIMLISGSVGLAGAALGYGIGAFSVRAFTAMWMAVAVVALVIAFFLARRQALTDAEPFWSPPTRRVTRALVPAFFSGLIAAIGGLVYQQLISVWLLTAVWLVAYGCGLHAAGFFLKKGLRLMSWVFMIAGSTIILSAPSCPWLQNPATAHGAMGLFFGAFHLACGVYLYFTERKNLE